MKKWILVLAGVLAGLQIYASGKNDMGSYTQKVFACDFADSSKLHWLVRNTDYFRFNILEGSYNLVCADATKQAYIPLKWENKLPNFRLSTSITFDKGSDYNGSAGVAFGVKGKLSSGYILEMDKRGKYRVQLVGVEGVENLTGSDKNKGWVKEGAINKAGKPNNIDIIANGKTIEIYINREKVFKTKYTGELGTGSGFFLNGAVKIDADFYNVYAETKVEKVKIDNTKIEPYRENDEVEKPKTKKEKKEKKKEEPVITPMQDTSARKHEQEPKKVVIEEKKKEPVPVKVEKKKQDSAAMVKPLIKEAPKDTTTQKVIVPLDDNPVIKDKPIEDFSKDISTLSTALSECRKTNYKLETNYNNCQSELGAVKKKQGELQDFINNNLDVKLQKELDAQTLKATQLEKNNYSLKDENTELRKFKDDFRKTKDGDLVIILSDNLKKEKEKTAALEKKILLLQQQLDAKKK
ncbi:MAG: hypothetical protein NTX03_05320 [Bacteroidetes bacterium]|nr:hypothetical protein [Bacteroidota bacterium]